MQRRTGRKKLSSREARADKILSAKSTPSFYETRNQINDLFHPRTIEKRSLSPGFYFYLSRSATKRPGIGRRGRPAFQRFTLEHKSLPPRRYPRRENLFAFFPFFFFFAATSRDRAISPVSLVSLVSLRRTLKKGKGVKESYLSLRNLQKFRNLAFRFRGEKSCVTRSCYREFGPPTDNRG